MFKKISCVVLGAVATSLISAVEPAQAFSFHSSGYGSSPTSGSVSSFSGQSTGFGQSSVGSSSSPLLSQSSGTGSTSVGNTTGVVDMAIIVLALWAMFEGLDTTSDGGNKNVVGIGDGFVNPPGIPGGGENGGGGIGGGGDQPPATVPSPALLPGLFGMGMAAVRKRNNNLAQADQA
ncbi:MAG: PTPA-CTERM sorting domain-containing protein [Cyanobacteria bacterium J06636_28]